MSRVCKVITTAFMPREVRLNTFLMGRPLGFFQHSQNFPTQESVIKLLEFILSIEDEVDPGAQVDLVIVNNDVGYEAGNNFLKSIEGRKTKSGTVKILNRENFGRSFGGYNFAYDHFQRDYDYFIFTEDDILINGDRYAEQAISILEKYDHVGFVAYQGINLDGQDNSRDPPRYSRDALKIHAHGGVGMAPARVLKMISDKYGFLPHATQDIDQHKTNIIYSGEVEFTNILIRNGFALAEIEASVKLYEYAYDKMRNISCPRYIEPEHLWIDGKKSQK